MAFKEGTGVLQIPYHAVYLTLFLSQNISFHDALRRPCIRRGKSCYTVIILQINTHDDVYPTLVAETRVVSGSDLVMTRAEMVQ